jgi:hypothetical protein
MDYGEQTTGTRDENYNLISVLYHALQGAENCDRYASDAEITGDERLAAFFRDAQGMQTLIAERAKGMLGIGGVSRREVFDAPPEGMVPRDAPPGDVRRGTTPDTPEDGLPAGPS